MVSVPLPPQSIRESLTDLHREELVELREVKLTEVCGDPRDWVLPEFLPLRLVRGEPPAICQLSFRLSSLSTGSHEGFCLWISASVKLWLCVFASFSPQFGDSGLPCDPTFFGRSKKSWFFSLVALLLITMEWWPPSFLHAGLKTFYFFLISNLFCFMRAKNGQPKGHKLRSDKFQWL